MNPALFVPVRPSACSFPRIKNPGFFSSGNTDERMAELLAAFVKDPLLPSLSSLVGDVALDRAMVDKEAAAKLEMRATLLAHAVKEMGLPAHPQFSSSTWRCSGRRTRRHSLLGQEVPGDALQVSYIK